MKKTHSLQLRPKTRDGGMGVTPREFLDFVVDGQALSERIGGDLVSCLGWLMTAENTRAVHRLLREEPPDFPNDRRSLYICPECGDLGCGAVSVVIEKTGNTVVWRDFGYQNNYEDTVNFAAYADLGSFVFERTEYENVIRRAL